MVIGKGSWLLGARVLKPRTQQPVPGNQEPIPGYDQELLQNCYPEYQKVFNIFNTEYKRHGYRHGLLNSDSFIGTG